MISRKKMLRIMLLICLGAGMILACLFIYLGAAGRVRAEDLADLDLKDGDIIFQVSSSSQSLAIQAATGSKYSHCGLIFQQNGQFYVFEAINRVSRTPLADWINRGVRGHFLVMRLKDRDKLLGSDRLRSMAKTGRGLAGKPYDLRFLWSDDKMYCSELVWKIYERGAGLILVKPKTFQDYNLDSELVREAVKQRFGAEVPTDEKVVAPSDLLDSPLLERVAGN